MRASASDRQHPASLADLVRVVWGLGQEDQARDAEAPEHLPRARIGLEPAFGEAGEHCEHERARIAARLPVLVARHTRKIGELGMRRLRVESVAVTTGDAGHAGAEAADDDRWRRRGFEESGVTRPEAADQLDRLDYFLRAHGVALDRLADRALLGGVGCALAAAGADPEEEPAPRDRLERRRLWAGHAGFLRPEPAPPIIVGGFGPRMAAIAGRHGDGFNTQAMHPKLADLARVAREEHKAAGRDPATFQLTVFAGLDPRWLDATSRARQGLERLDVARLILLTEPPYDPEEIRQAGRMLTSAQR